jgi:hypothetical protein
MGGSPIENDSDQVILLDHSNYERVSQPGNDHALTQLLLGKNRHGSMSEIPVKIDFRCLRITEIQHAGATDNAGAAPAVEYELRGRDAAVPEERDEDRGEAYEPPHVAPDDLDFFSAGGPQ